MRLKQYRGTWCAVWNDGTATRRASLRTADRAVAEQRFQSFIKESKTPSRTVAEIFAAYEADKKGTASYDGLKFIWKKLAPYFGNLTPEQVDRDLSRSYRAFRLKAGISDGTVHRELGMLRAALRWHDPKTPAIVELPSKPQPKDRYLTLDEYKTLLSAAEAAHVRLFIILALATAARAGAILDMIWDQVDFERGLIRLSKGRESRLKGRATVPMTVMARDALAAAYEARETDWVIEWAGQPITSIKSGFRRTAARGGLKGVTPHVLRHTAAVWMAEAGTPMSEIAQYLGHRSTAVTERVYARYSPDYLRRAASALEVQM